MMVRLSASVALVALVTSVASAQINAKWTDCGAGGTTNICSACGSALDPPRDLLFSWFPVEGATQVVGYDMRVTFAVSGVTAKPCWWDFAPGTPRAAGYAFIPTDTPPACPSFLGAFGQPIAVGGYQDLGAHRGRFNIFVANPFGSGADATRFMGVELFAVKLQIRAAGTGPGCLGCTEPTEIRLNEIILANEGGLPAIALTEPADFISSNCATWQFGLCDAVTPARAATWGSVKALYR